MARKKRTNHKAAKRDVAATLLGTWGVYHIITGLYFIFARPSLLPEDLRASVTTIAAVRRAAPGLEAWLDWVFAVLGGQMAASGVLLAGAAFRVVRGHRPNKVEVAAYGAAGLLSVTLMSGINFALGSDFRWFLVGPVILWLAIMLVLGRRSLDGTPQF